jgi:sulfite reductase (ferredoxin)
MSNTSTIKKKTSKLEQLKENSNFLREPIATELKQDTTHFSEDGIQILKFHGSYQQDNRDNRQKGQEKDYQFMLRTRSPGGYIPHQLYLTLDQLSDEYGNHTLRATTRQGYQIHGILKKDLKAVISRIVKSMGSTLGACGDLNRNVMAPPAPFKNSPEYQYAWEYADKVADLLTPQTGAYYEIWLDGEKVISGEEAPEVKQARETNKNGTNFTDSVEPIYGNHYMPRKFKCSVTVPGDNSIDVYTHDLSLVVITNRQGELQGFNIIAGGGLGRTHRKEQTFARSGDEIGFVAKKDIFDLVKAIVATQRDYSDRVDRRHARLKYLINDWGVEKFKAKVEEYFGKKIKPLRKLKKWKFQNYLGWHEQGDGKLFLGVSIENGRVKDENSLQLKEALKKVIEKYELPSRLTGNHNVILYEIEPQWQNDINDIFARHGVTTNPKEINHLTQLSMACPALPTCGLATTESERILPSVNERIDALLAKVGIPKETFVIRMTGCPNGCARPYMAELGFVGDSPNVYQMWLGGCPNQTRLARPFVDKLHLDDLETFLEPLFVFFRDDKQRGETFGQFCDRIGFDVLKEYQDKYDPSTIQVTKIKKAKKKRHEHRISLNEEWYQKLKTIAKEDNKAMSQIVTSALEAYLND